LRDARVVEDRTVDAPERSPSSRAEPEPRARAWSSRARARSRDGACGHYTSRRHSALDSLAQKECALRHTQGRGSCGMESGAARDRPGCHEPRRGEGAVSQDKRKVTSMGTVATFLKVGT